MCRNVDWYMPWRRPNVLKRARTVSKWAETWAELYISKWRQYVSKWSQNMSKFGSQCVETGSTGGRNMPNLRAINIRQILVFLIYMVFISTFCFNNKRWLQNSKVYIYIWIAKVVVLPLYIGVKIGAPRQFARSSKWEGHKWGNTSHFYRIYFCPEVGKFYKCFCFLSFLKTLKGVFSEHWCWRHPMETCCALLAFCEGNSSVTGVFPSQRPVTRSFDVFLDQRLNKRLKQTVETPVIWDAITPIMTSL